jgi:hypothetical protein
MVGECFFYVPLGIFRSEVLRQGSLKFYSLSFQAILTCFFASWACRSPEAKLVTNFSFPLDRASPLHWLKMGGNIKKYSKACEGFIAHQRPLVSQPLLFGLASELFSLLKVL